MIVAGLGCSLGCRAEELLALLDGCLREAGVGREEVGAVATVDRRGSDPGMLEAVRAGGWQLRTFAPAELAAVDVPTPSQVVEWHVGTASVAEAAARLGASGGSLILPKRRSAAATCALAQQAP